MDYIFLCREDVGNDFINPHFNPLQIPLKSNLKFNVYIFLSNRFEVTYREGEREKEKRRKGISTKE